ncbi:MAG: hypothetical protein E7164_02255 [Firmicutes bacterium]|nr:hypothetical protein [Bacillota bacterium]
MNIEIVKKELCQKIGSKVRVTVYGLRNKIERYEGLLYKIYPNIFTILYDNEEKSFAYRDVITKDINVKFL